jgi:hypothetical protein
MKQHPVSHPEWILTQLACYLPAPSRPFPSFHHTIDFPCGPVSLSSYPDIADPFNWLLSLKPVPHLQILLPWRWKRYNPPKRRFTQELHSTTTQKMSFFHLFTIQRAPITLVSKVIINKHNNDLVTGMLHSAGWRSVTNWTNAIGCHSTQVPCTTRTSCPTRIIVHHLQLNFKNMTLTNKASKVC